MVGRKEFEMRKEAVLRALASEEKDKSRKGGVDAPIADLISRINSHPSYFTTSSCSGRISVFVEHTQNDGPAEPGGDGKSKKKGGEWVFISHEAAEVDELVLAVRREYEEHKHRGLLVFRFEPFILVLECCSLPAAQQLMACAQASGYRESGMSSVGKRIIVGVRSSIRLEVPIGEKGQLIVPEEYLRYLTVSANKKFILNQQRISRFLSTFLKQIGDQIAHPIEATSQLTKSEHAKERQRRRKATCLEIQDKLLSSLEKRQLNILAEVNRHDAHTGICSIIEEQTSHSEVAGDAEFACGTDFSPTLLLNLKPSADGITFHVKNDQGKVQHSKELPHEFRESGMQQLVNWVLKVEKYKAKVTKDALKQIRWLDLSRKSKLLDEGTHVAFPILEVAIPFCLKDGVVGQVDPFQQNSAAVTRAEKCRTAEVLGRLLACGGEVLKLGVPPDSKHHSSPLEALQTGVSALLEQNGLAMSLLEDLPKRWERLGDMIVLPAGSLCGPTWSSLGEQLWRTCALSLKASRLAHQAPIASTGTRDSQLQLLYGHDGWVEHRENGILYCFDATKCMFSSGNVSERLRIASITCKGATVVDLFAGIGYYVLPFLLKAGAQKVYACEWNPHAVFALRHNLRVNGVENMCEVIEGDNRTTAPQGIADIVYLGLLPTSEGSWPVAVRALRPDGGILFIHGNIKDTEEKAWTDHVLTSVSRLATLSGRKWDISITHFERVKWYAPHIRHVVADVCCRQVLDDS